MEPASVYKPSGESGNAMVLVPMFAIPLSLIMGIVYAYISVYNPLIGVISFLLPLGFGALFGLGLTKAVSLAKCRNPRLVLLTCGAATVFVMYCVWASFIYVFLDHINAPVPLTTVFLGPAGIFNTMSLIAVNGWYTVKGTTPSGIVLWLFWVCEAGMIAYLAVTMPLNHVKETLFCEDCNDWCAAKKDLARYLPTGETAKNNRIKDGDLTVLAELTPATKTAPLYMRLDSQRCGKCSRTSTFQLSQISITKDKNGKPQEKVEKLTELVILTPESLTKLQDALVKQASTPVPAKPPAEPESPAPAADEPA